MAQSERSPLLRPTRPHGPARQISLIPQLQSPRFVVFLIFFALFVLMFGSFLAITPQLRVYEDIICRHYYDEVVGDGHVALTEDIDESLCKIGKIQEELAIIVGGASVAESVPSLLFALPYGVLGDRIGRKPVFGLAVTGLILCQMWTLTVCWFWRTFPLRLIWLSPIFQIIGGGTVIVQATIYASINDVSTEANRANNFFWVGCGVMAAQFIAPTVSSWLMRSSPWIPLIASIAIITLGGLLMLFVPETLHQKPVNGSIDPVAELPALISDRPSASGSSTKRSLMSGFKENYVNTFNTLRIYASPIFFVLMVTFLTHLFGYQIIDQVMRYISKRFSWTLAQTGFLLSLRALVNIVLFLAVLPIVSHILTSSSGAAYSIPGLRFHLSTASKDLVLARVSLVAQVIGLFLLAISALPSTIAESTGENALPLILAIIGIIVYTLGMGFSSFCRSLISTLVAHEHITRLYAVLSIADVVGASIGGPTLAGLYSWGLTLSREGERNGFLGMPFWGAMIITTLTGGGVMWVRAPERKDDTVEEDEIRTAENDLQAEMLM